MKPKSLNRFLTLGMVSMIVVCSSATAAPITKETTGTDLALGASWVGGTGPGTADVGTWTSSSLGGALTVGSAVSWQGLNVSDATANIATTGSAITLGSAGITLTGSKTLSIANNIALGSAQSWSIADATASSAVDATVTGAITGAFALTKTGAGTLSLGGINTGLVTTVDGGFLRITDAQSLGGRSNANGPALSIKSGTLDLGFNSSTGTYAANATNVSLRNGNITLGGTAGATSALTSTGVVTSNPVGFGLGPGFGTSLSYNATNNGDTATISALWASTGTSNVASTTVTVGDSTFTNLELDFTGRISNSQIDGRNVTLVKAGAGTMRISAQNFLPGLTVSAGKLISNHANALGTARTLANLVTVDGTGTLDLNGFSNSIGGLAGATATTAVITNGNSTASVLSVGSSNASTSYSGKINDGTGTVGLTKIGSGTLTLAGGGTFSGATTVSTGTLSVTGSQTGSAVTVASAATLGGTGTVGTTTVSTGGILAPGVSGAGKLTTGNLTFSGTGTITLGNYSGYSATPALAAGSLTASGAAGSVTINLGGATAVNGTYQLLTYTGGSIGGTGASAFVLGTKPATGGRQSQVLVDTGSALNWVVSGANPIWTGAVSTEWSTNTISGSKNWKLEGDGSPTDYISGDLVIFDDSATSSTVDLSVASVAPGSMLFTNATLGYTIQGTNGITAGSLTKTGAGSLTLNTANSYSGGSTLGGGTITLGTGTALGTGSVALNAGTLDLNAQSIPNAVVLGGGAISGSGTIGGNVTGSALSYTVASGTLILGGTNSVAATVGATSTLQIGTGSTFGTIGNVTNAGALIFNRSDALTYSGTITGAGSVQKSGAGTLTFSAANSYSGATSVTGSGRLVVSNTLLNSSSFSVGSGATLEFGGNNLFVAGHGTAMAATRAINVNGGTLVMNTSFEARFGNVNLTDGATWTSNRALTSYDALLGDTTTGAATVTVSGSAAAMMNGTGGIHLQGVQNFDVADVTGSSAADLVVSMVLGAQGTTGGTAGGINKLGTGTMVLSGTNTYTGATTINAGTLQLGNGGTTGTMGTGAVTNNSALVLNYGTGATVTLANAISGTGTLTKQGLGTATLTATSLYSGATTIEQGTLRIGGHLDNTALTVQSAARLATGPQATAGVGYVKALTLDAGSTSTFRIGSSNWDTIVVNDTDAATLSGTHTITLVYQGGLNPGDQRDIIDYSGTLGGSFSDFQLAPGTRFQLVDDAANSNVVVQYTGGNVIWKGNLSSAWDVDTTANWQLESDSSVTNYLQGDTVVFNDSATTGTVTLTGTIAPISATFNNPTLDYTLSGSPITTGNLIKNGAATATLLNENTTTGTTTVTAGKLAFGNGGATGSIGSGAVSVASGATLELNRSNAVPGTPDLDYKTTAKLRNVSGAGDIVLTGGAILFNYPGTTVGFSDANSWAGFSGNLVIKGGSEFRTIRNGATAMGTGSVILGDATTSGILSQIEGNWTWTNNIVLTGASNKILNRSVGVPRSNKLQGVISGSGGLSLEDPAASMNEVNRGFILTGANTMNGTLTIATGVPVRVGGVPGNTDVSQSEAGVSGSLGTATVVNNGTLTFSRTNAHSVSNAISGSGSVRVGIPSAAGFGDTSTQVLTYTGTATYTGATTVNNGTLVVDTGASLGGSGVSVLATATLSGSGSVAAAVTAAGTIAPGSGVGTLTVSGNTAVTGTLAIEVNTSADKLAVTGDLSLSGTFTVTESGAGFTAASYVIAECSGTLTSTLTPPVGYTLTQTGSQLILGKITGTAFSNWIDDFTLGGQTAINQDPDADGVANGLEFVLKGGNPETSGGTQLPTSSESGTNLIFTFERDDRAKAANLGMTITVEAGTNLSTWPEVFTIGNDTAGSSAGVVISNDGDANPDTVTVTIPKSSATTKFARLKVTGTP